MYEGYLGFTGNTTDNNMGALPIIPAVFDGGEGASQGKLCEDRYEVFVNGDKVGDKIQRTQVEDSAYLQSYLQKNGFKGFNYEVQGDHIEIQTDQDPRHMKEILASYLSLR